MHFKLPFPIESPGNCSVEQFDHFCYLSQVVQGLCVKAQTEHYRRLMGSKYHCMGTLYWQANDIWPAPTCKFNIIIFWT